MKNLHEEMKNNIHDSNKAYKDREYKKMRYNNFEVGDEIMVHLNKKIFLVGI